MTLKATSHVMLPHLLSPASVVLFSTCVAWHGRRRERRFVSSFSVRRRRERQSCSLVLQTERRSPMDVGSFQVEQTSKGACCLLRGLVSRGAGGGDACAVSGDLPGDELDAANAPRRLGFPRPHRRVGLGAMFSNIRSTQAITIPSLQEGGAA